jgi:NAD(P)-dependent dehydrogenase (short-subunit alcohol dehydrogenase family)
LLINNAGLFATRLQHTQEGFEMQFGVNHLGPFLLSHLLLPALAAAPEPRLVNVASRAHDGGWIDFDDLRGEKSPYRGGRAYARSKLANVLFAREWTRRFPGIPANSLHPGTLRTAIGNKHGPWYVSLAWSLVKPFRWPGRWSSRSWPLPNAASRPPCTWPVLRRSPGSESAISTRGNANAALHGRRSTTRWPGGFGR